VINLKNKNSAIVLVLLVLAVMLLSVFFYETPFSSNNSTSNGTRNTSNTLSSSSDSAVVSTNFNVRLAGSMALPNVAQRFDHMSIDPSANLVFIAARGNNSVYVAELTTKVVTHIITGLKEPQGVFYVSQYNRLFVSNAGDGTVEVYDVGNFSLIKTLTFSSNADNMRYDPKAGLLYVGFGEGNQSGIGIINASFDEVSGTIPLDGHPEAFELEQNGTKIYANVPTASSIEVLDRATRRVVSTWQLTSALANYPMALDERDHRLFVGFWYPSELAAYNTDTGKIVASLNLPTDVDDLFYDPVSRFIFASCGQGILDVIKQQNSDSYQAAFSLTTGPLGRTALFFPDQSELFVAVPQHGGVSAQLLTFKIVPS
jgi:DNA-binding beta-propeller fold protein YncE